MTITVRNRVGRGVVWRPMMGYVGDGEEDERRCGFSGGEGKTIKCVQLKICFCNLRVYVKVVYIDLTPNYLRYVTPSIVQINDWVTLY